MVEEVELTRENYRSQVELLEERSRRVADRSVTGATSFVTGGSVQQRHTSYEMQFSNNFRAEPKDRLQTSFPSMSMSTASRLPLEHDEDVPIPADGAGNPIIDYYNLEHQFTFQRYGDDSKFLVHPEKHGLQGDTWANEDNMGQSHSTGPHQVCYIPASYSLAENSHLYGTNAPNIHITSSGGQSPHPEHWRELDSSQILTLPHQLRDAQNGLLAQHRLYNFPRQR